MASVVCSQYRRRMKAISKRSAKSCYDMPLIAIKEKMAAVDKALVRSPPFGFRVQGLGFRVQSLLFTRRCVRSLLVLCVW